MKLVDILAQELKAWPDGVYCLTQSLVDTEIYNCLEGNAGSSVYSLTPRFDATKTHTQGDYPIVTRDQWQAAVDALKSESAAQAWSGSGLPPVGTVCEHFGTADHTNWIEVQVIGHGHVRHHDVAFFEYIDQAKGQNGCNGYTVSYSTVSNFRPVRTPEQIAAEEHEKEIEDLEAVLRAISTSYYPEIAKALVTAGYRKQVSP